MKTSVFELTPSNGRKSFYGKAKVVESGGARYLRSYDTTVGCVDASGETHRFTDRDSATTRAHVKSFCEQFSRIDHKAFWKLPRESAPVLNVCV